MVSRDSGRSDRVGWTPFAVVGLLAVLAMATIWASAEDTTAPPAKQGHQGERVDPTDAYNPVSAGEPLPDGFVQLLPRDAIRPVYDPTFVAADRTEWSDDTDVIGVADGGEAKAYPVQYLSGRELVNDEINEKPIVVTW